MLHTKHSKSSEDMERVVWGGIVVAKQESSILELPNAEDEEPVSL